MNFVLLKKILGIKFMYKNKFFLNSGTKNEFHTKFRNKNNIFALFLFGLKI